MALLRLTRSVPSRGSGAGVLEGGVLEYVLRASDFFRSVAMDREKNTAFFDSSFVSLRFVLRNPQTDQGAYQTTHRASYSEAGQSTHDRSRGNEWTNARDRKRANW